MPKRIKFNKDKTVTVQYEGKDPETLTREEYGVAELGKAGRVTEAVKRVAGQKEAAAETRRAQSEIKEIQRQEDVRLAAQFLSEGGQVQPSQQVTQTTPQEVTTQPQLKTQQAQQAQQIQPQLQGSLIEQDIAQRKKDVISGALNFGFDPLRGLSAKGQEAAAAVPQDSVIGRLNTQGALFIETSRQVVQELTKFAFSQTGRVTGQTKQLKEKLSQSKSILADSTTALKDLNRLVEEGYPLELALRDREQIKLQIAEAEQAVKSLSSNNVTAFLSGAIDNQVEFENYRTVTEPALDFELQQIINNRNAVQMQRQAAAQRLGLA